MRNIHSTFLKLEELLTKESYSLEISQRIQFEWLQSIQVQLDIFSDNDSNFSSPHSSLENSFAVIEDADAGQCLSIQNRKNDENRPPNENSEQSTFETEKQNEDQNEDTEEESGSTSATINMSFGENRSATSPCFDYNTIRFVDDNSILLNDSESSDENDILDAIPIPFTISGSMNELAQSASSFREKWLEMLHQKKASTSIPKKAFKFAFEEESAIPEGYQISDDSDDEPDDYDDEIYNRNPMEIHGKTIPNWARGDQLLKQLKRQQRIDPDSIFLGFTADCPLQELFNSYKARWDNRSDSGWWDSDRVTEEEVAKFKAALGLI